MSLTDTSNRPITLDKTYSRSDGLKRLLGALLVMFGAIWLLLTLTGVDILVFL